MLLCLTFFLTPHDSRAHIPQSNRSPRYSTSPSALRLDRSSTGPSASPAERPARRAESGLRRGSGDELPHGRVGVGAAITPPVAFFSVRSNICIIFWWNNSRKLRASAQLARNLLSSDQSETFYSRNSNPRISLEYRIQLFLQNITVWKHALLLFFYSFEGSRRGTAGGTSGYLNGHLRVPQRELALTQNCSNVQHLAIARIEARLRHIFL